jgi:FAD/FMN-containing dehydrogenase
MQRWSNWSGKLMARPAAIHCVKSELDAVAVALETARSGSTVRSVGAAHSHYPLVPTDGTIVDVSGLNGIISIDSGRKRARIRAGTAIHALGLSLLDDGLGLINQGDIDRQTIAGATATGTHGTGADLQNFSAMVTGLSIATANGELVRACDDNNVELWTAARHHLGAFGIVTEVELQLCDAYRLRETGWNATLDETLETLPELVHAHRHLEFFWFPTTDTTVIKATDETNDPAEYPIADEGSRCGWSHEVLSNSRTWLHSEMEYAVPLDAGPDCLAAIRDLLRRDFPEMPFPIEYRTVAADDVWLSVAYERPTVTISLHMDAREDDEPLFRAAESLFTTFEGRPHWGKVHYRTGAEMASLHPRWDDWWDARDTLDPGGVFLNNALRRLRNG